MRISTQIFSVLLAAATTFSAMAAPQQLAQKAKGRVGQTATMKAKFGGQEQGKPLPRAFQSLRTAKSPLSTEKFGKQNPIVNRSNIVAHASSAMPVINGLISFSEDPSFAVDQIGVYTVPTSSEEAFVPVALNLGLNQGCTMTPDFYAGFDFQTFWGMLLGANYRTYDIESGELLGDVDIMDSYTNVALDLTYDATTQAAYGISYSDDGANYVLAKYDLTATSFTRTEIATFSFAANMIAADKNGQLWVVGDGLLYKVDKTTGEATLVGDTGHPTGYLASMAFDQKTDRLFMTVSTDDEGYICEVNTTTGAATPLNVFENAEEVVGLYVAAPLAEDGAPDAAQNAVASFPDGTMTGTIEFDAPTTLFDGTPATGKVAYMVTANGELVAQGNTMYGTKGISVTYTAEKPGMVEFIIIFSNEVGNSPAAKIKAFVGNGTPSPSANAVAEYDNSTSTMSVSWLPVTTSADGGYIDPAKVTYAVFDGNAEEGAAPLAKDLTATEWSTMFPAPENYTLYSYKIVAYFDGAASGAAVTNSVALGAMNPAFDYPFSNGLTGWTIIDGNEDLKVWEQINATTVGIMYNSKLDMDDWLISMPVRLEGGKMYDVTVHAWSRSATYVETVEVMYGAAPTADALTNEVIKPTVLATETEQEPITGKLICPADGIYYIGIHGISEADSYTLYVDDFKVSEGTSSAVPAAADNFDVVPAANGVKKATVSFDAPTLTAAGDALSAITKVEVSRNGEVAKTFDAPAVGAALSFVDEVATPGNYTYTVVAYNDKGAGLEAEKTVYIGFALPAAPEYATLVEGETPGTATIAWAPVTEDVNGTALSTDDVKYLVAQSTADGWEIIAQDIVLPAYSYQAVPAGQQEFCQYAVFAVTEAGMGQGVVTDFRPLGTPYNGIDETFANGTLNYIWGVTNASGWGLFNEASLGVADADGNDGFIAYQASSNNPSASLFSGFISLEGLTNPALTFYTYCIAANDNNTVKVEACERNGEWQELMTTVVNEVADGDEWGKITANLADFAGKTIQIRLTATAVQYVFTMFDAIKTVSLLDNDLAATSITAPATVATCSDYTVQVAIENEGAKKAEGYKVELYANGEVVKTFEGDALESGATASFSYDASFDAIATEPVTYSAKIVYAEDLNADNNETEEVVVMPKANKLPVVEDLHADGIKLLWSEPDLTKGAGQPTTVDFEDGESFAHEYEGFTFVDGDESAVGGFQNLDIPGITPGTTLASFFVFDSAYDGFNQTFAAHSGNKYLAAMFRYDDGTTDDWMITPELKLGGQTISFYARSYSSDYPEKLQLCYSKTSTDVTTFQVLETVDKVPAEWTLYTVEVPEDAKYFAINSCAKGSFMLMIDDFTYVPANAPAQSLTIKGYNVWRDGVKITETPVEECEYSDPNAPEGQSTYVVTVVYDLGESGASNEVTLGVSGLDEIEASLEITTIPGAVVVKGAGEAEVTVFSIDGKTVYAGKGDAVIPAAAGIYVVKAADKVAKVLVK